MPAISPARAANVATHVRTKLYTKIMSYMSSIYAWPYLSELTSTTIHKSEFVLLVSGLPQLCST